MVQQGDFGMGAGGIGEVVQIFWLAAVIDQDDVRKAMGKQPVNDGGELFVRVQGGQHNGNLR